MKFGSLIVAAFAAAITAPAAQAQPVNIRVAHCLPESAMPHPAWMQWLQSMEAASNGALKIQMFANGQLGKAQDQYDMGRDGIADLSWAVPGFSPGRFPIFSATELPMIVSHSARGARVFHEWYRPFAAAEMPDIHYCMAQLAPVSHLSTVAGKRVASPSDVAGLKVRPQNVVGGRFFTSLGSTLISVSASEARQALDRGVADSITFPLRSLIDFNLHNVLRNHTDIPLVTAPSVWVMNKAKYASLPPAAKAAVDSHCTAEWAEKTMAVWNDWNEEGRQRLTANGNSFVPVSADARTAWLKAAQEFRAVWVSDVSKAAKIDAQAALDDLTAKLKAVNAAE